MIDVAILRAAGLTEEQIVKVLEFVSVTLRNVTSRYKKAEIAQEKFEASREQNRIRQRNYRARHGDRRDKADSDAGPILPSLTSSVSKKEKEERKKEIATGKTLPPDWLPSESHFQQGERLGLSRPTVEGYAQDMRLWASANRNRAIARKADWNATFAGWLRRNGHAKQTADPAPMTQAARELARRTEEYKAQLAARKANQNGAKTQAELVRRNANGSGEGSTNQEPETVLQKGQGVHGNEQSARKRLADD